MSMMEKSTLIGRLLHDTRQIYEDQLSTLQNESKKIGTQGEKLDLALLVDGLAAEREQGITIDVAYRYFQLQSVSLLLLIHRTCSIYPQYGDRCINQYAFYSADRCSKGVQEQTRRHSFISTLLGIRHLIVAINKWICGLSASNFDSIQQDYLHFADQLPTDLTIEFVLFLPLMVTMCFSLIEYALVSRKNVAFLLEDAPVKLGSDMQSLRFPVQYVNRPDLDFRGYSGTVSSGVLYQGNKSKYYLRGNVLLSNVLLLF